jgi:hypothetical protein
LIYRLIIFALFVGVGFAQGQTIYIPQIAHGNGIETEFNFINLSEDMNRIGVRAFDNDGNPVNLLLADASPFLPMQAVEELGSEIPGLGVAQLRTYSETPDMVVVGYAEIYSDFDAPFGVEVAFRSFAQDGTLVTTTSVLPQPVSDAFSIIAYNNDFASSGFALLNPPSSDGSATVDMALYDHFGVMLGETTVVLEPGEKIARFLSEDPLFDDILAGVDDFIGSVEVISDIPVSVTVIKLEEGDFFTTQTVQPSR